MAASSAVGAWELTRQKVATGCDWLDMSSGVKVPLCGANGGLNIIMVEEEIPDITVKSPDLGLAMNGLH
jgi:hypothetical protein